MNQAYQNLEIILVDDGSPDRCPEICDKYAEDDRRINVIHKKNGGVSSARNCGIDIATGEYIFFLDGDDWLDMNCLSILMAVAWLENADFVICAAKEISCNADYSTVSADEIYEKDGRFTVLTLKTSIYSHFC
jgi:glycosyltransferase involved in cell wall biosynthesis